MAQGKFLYMVCFRWRADKISKTKISFLLNYLSLKMFNKKEVQDDNFHNIIDCIFVTKMTWKDIFRKQCIFLKIFQFSFAKGKRRVFFFTRSLCISYTYETSCIAFECFTLTRGIVFEFGKRERGEKDPPWGLKMMKTR